MIKPVSERQWICQVCEATCCGTESLVLGLQDSEPYLILCNTCFDKFLKFVKILPQYQKAVVIRSRYEPYIIKVIDEIVSNRICEVVNRAIDNDYRAMESLFDIKVRTNKKMANDETIRVDKTKDAHYVGVLGLLSGISGINKDKVANVYAKYSVTEDGEFRELVSMELTPKKERKKSS